MKYAGSARWSPAVVALVLVTGCGAEPADQDLCAQYADVQAAMEELRSEGLQTENAEAFRESVDDLRQRADRVRDELDQLQRVSEGRLDTVIGLARQRAAAINESLTVAAYEAAETLGPQITAAQEELDSAVAQLNQRLETQCPDQ
jgi:hypothetical protein